MSDDVFTRTEAAEVAAEAAALDGVGAVWLIEMVKWADTNPNGPIHMVGLSHRGRSLTITNRTRWNRARRDIEKG